MTRLIPSWKPHSLHLLTVYSDPTSMSIQVYFYIWILFQTGLGSNYWVSMVKLDQIYTVSCCYTYPMTMSFDEITYIFSSPSDFGESLFASDFV